MLLVIFLSVMIKNDAKQAQAHAAIKQDIGRGGFTSANIGDIIVTVLAKKLQIPNTVPANKVGNS